MTTTFRPGELRALVHDELYFAGVKCPQRSGTLVLSLSEQDSDIPIPGLTQMRSVLTQHGCLLTWCTSADTLSHSVREP